MKKISLVSFVKFIFIIAIVCVAFLFSGCDRRRIREANERIEDAISRVNVRAEGQYFTLGTHTCTEPHCEEHFRCQTRRLSFEYIYVNVDFENLLFEKASANFT